MRPIKLGMATTFATGDDTFWVLHYEDRRTRNISREVALDLLGLRKVKRVILAKVTDTSRLVLWELGD